MDRIANVLPKVRAWSRLLQAAGEGITPEQIKAAVFDTLCQVLPNRTALDAIGLDLLIGPAVCVQRVLDDGWSANRFRYCLGVYRQALATDAPRCLDECARWEPSVRRGLGQYWSAVQLEQPKSDLALEEFASVALRDIGDLIEGTLQPYLRALLAQLRVVRRKDPAAIEQLDLGNVVAELADTGGVRDLFIPGPWYVPLNQWRNLAKHHSYEVTGDSIRCWYGKGPKLRSISLSREELWEALRRVFGVHMLIKTARDVFILEHLADVGPRLGAGSERPDATMFRFAATAATQGFEVVSASAEKAVARATLRDASDRPWRERQFHASQFVQVLWAHTGAEVCEVEYQRRDGTPTLLTVAQATDCEKVGRREMDMGELAQRVELRSLLGHDPEPSPSATNS